MHWSPSIAAVSLELLPDDRVGREEMRGEEVRLVLEPVGIAAPNWRIEKLLWRSAGGPRMRSC